MPAALLYQFDISPVVIVMLPDVLGSVGSCGWRGIWLNPLMGDSRYRPLARGMEAALPFVEHFTLAHNLAAFEQFITLVPA
jgi:uncharacterized protein with von Willebrand factor type A (vWA) domain